MDGFLLQSDIEEIGQRLKGEAHQLAGKTILMSGGLGFLGRYFIEVFAYLNREVLKTPCKVIAMDNLITAGKISETAKESMEFTFIEHDVIQPLPIDEPVHYLLSMAGIASPYYYRAYPLETLEVAVTGHRNMLELARKNHARITFFSSSEIYGDPDPKHVPTPESYRGNVACQGPRACYDESKRLGETLCYIYHENYQVATNVIRPFNVFGPGMQEADYRVLPNFASSIKGKRPLTVYGNGSQTRTYCYITDAMVGFTLTMLNGVPGEAYNIGNPKPEISVLELVKRIETALGRSVDHKVMEYPDSYPADEPNRRCPDIRKAKLQLKYQPEVSIEEGLKRFLGWTDERFTGEQ